MNSKRAMGENQFLEKFEKSQNDTDSMSTAAASEVLANRLSDDLKIPRNL